MDSTFHSPERKWGKKTIKIYFSLNVNTVNIKYE